MGNRAHHGRRGAETFGLEGPVDPDTFKAVLEGEVPDGSGKRLGRKTREGGIEHRPGRDLTFSAPKSVSWAAINPTFVRNTLSYVVRPGALNLTARPGIRRLGCAAV